jgi:hypothetical protein
MGEKSLNNNGAKHLYISAQGNALWNRMHMYSLRPEKAILVLYGLITNSLIFKQPFPRRNDRDFFIISHYFFFSITSI